MTGWYQRFISGYAHILEPLYNLKRKRSKFVWTKEVQKSYETLKEALVKAPVPTLPDESKEFQLFIDASSCGLEAMLVQEGKEVVYASKTLNKA